MGKMKWMYMICVHKIQHLINIYICALLKKKIERNSINNPSSERQPTKTKEVCTKNLKRRNSDSSCFSMKSISSNLSEMTSGDHLYGNTEVGLSDTCFIMQHNSMANENDMSNFEICSDIDCSTSCQTVIFQNPN